MQSDRDSTGLSARPVGLAIAGLGGFAESIADLVLDAQASAVGPSLRLIAVGDPAARLPAFASRRKALEQMGIRVFDTFEEACGVSGVEAAWLPVPIHQHRRLTEMALGAGRHVMCEKPLAGSLADAQAMLAVQRSSGLGGVIGFHSLFHPQTLDIKRRLLDGEIGAIRGATVIAAWPRGSVYFGRNGWAGRRFVDGTPVMDSPANNAMAHFLMLAMFFLGDSLA